ncbi:MAG: hypothetical protein ABI682_02920 [Acidobacteriota bacterium]
MQDPRLRSLRAAQRALRSRFDDFRSAFERRDEAAYRVAIDDFVTQLRRWTTAEERTLLPALVRAPIENRDTQRELRLEFVQLRELGRFLLEQLTRSAPLSDVLGLVENLDRRLAAHESELDSVYYEAAVGVLRDEEWKALLESAPSD